MNPENTPQKQRQRDEIARHVEYFLRQGGEIRVIEPPRQACLPRLNNTWIGREDLDFLLNRGG